MSVGVLIERGSEVLTVGSEIVPRPGAVTRRYSHMLYMTAFDWTATWQDRDVEVCDHELRRAQGRIRTRDSAEEPAVTQTTHK